MWSPRALASPGRRAVLAALGAALTGCGFAPVYGPYGAGVALHGRVALTPPETPFDYRLRAELEDRLGRAEDAAYQLDLTVTQARAPAAMAADGSLTRTTLTGTVSFRLSDLATQMLLAEGTADAFTAFSTTGSTVATAAAAADAEARLAVLLADEVMSWLLTTSLPR